MQTDTFRHTTREFQGWTKAQQVAHLREAHGLTVTENEATRIEGRRTPAADTLYQRHITAHFS